MGSRQVPSERHASEHVFATRRTLFRPAALDLVHVGSRRWFLQTGLAGLAGLSVPDWLRLRGRAASQPAIQKTSVILFWLSGGPSHLDMWDPKPDAPGEIRGPFRSVPTKVPGIRVCEHLPLQARIMDKLTLIRSVDCRASDHTPITMQSGNALARRTDDGKDGGGYPSMGSVAAKLRGPNDPDLPAFVGLADSWVADVWGAGHMGHAYEPVKGNELQGRLSMPKGINVARLRDRNDLCRQFDRLRQELDTKDTMARMDRYAQQAFDMVLSGKAQKAFRVDLEPDRLRDAYGRSPMMTPTAGRGHWTNCMSMLVAGGGLPCGQIIGSTDSKGYDIKERRVLPSDLAATVFRHLGIDPRAHWLDPRGRPVPIVTEGGCPILELS